MARANRPRCNAVRLAMALAISLHAWSAALLAFRYLFGCVGLGLLHVLLNIRNKGLTRAWFDCNPAVEVIHLGPGTVVPGMPRHHPTVVSREDENPVLRDQNRVVEAAAGGVLLVADARQDR